MANGLHLISTNSQFGNKRVILRVVACKVFYEAICNAFDWSKQIVITNACMHNAFSVNDYTHHMRRLIACIGVHCLRVFIVCDWYDTDESQLC
jgi:hypothetical protein